MSNMQIAQTIISQLGGEKFSQVVQPFNMTPEHQGLSFQFKPVKSGRMNKVEIRLLGDHYEMEFHELDSTGRAVNKEKETGVSAHLLARMFSAHTGIRWS